MFSLSGLRGIIFDLDGTLYVSKRFATGIHDIAVSYIASLRQTSLEEAAQLLATTRLKLAEASGTVQTLSAVCNNLGGSIQDLHRLFENNLRPESYLERDARVVRLLELLAQHYSLYIYTNNNRVMTARIINYLGIERVVSDIFTVDDEWRAKPDAEMVNKILEKTGLSPIEALFVGDRYDIDLRVPEQLGCPIYLSQSLDQLLRLEDLLISPLFEDRPATS